MTHIYRLIRFCALFSFCVLLSFFARAEDDYVKPGFKNEREATFRASRIINMHSVENLQGGFLDFRVSHRFGLLKGGFYEFFGLDQAQTRIGLEYAPSDRMMIGIGRSSRQKILDGFARYNILEQMQNEEKFMPVSVTWYSNAALITDRGFIESSIEDDTDYIHRMAYVHKAIIGRRFSPSFSAQIAPILIHKNLVEKEAFENTLWAIGMAASYDLTKYTSVIGEYHFLGPGATRDQEGFQDALSIGFDIETGEGHVFELHFTNTSSMVPMAYITETKDAWLGGEIRFGFNISRMYHAGKLF